MTGETRGAGGFCGGDLREYDTARNFLRDVMYLLKKEGSRHGRNVTQDRSQCAMYLDFFGSCSLKR